MKYLVIEPFEQSANSARMVTWLESFDHKYMPHLKTLVFTDDGGEWVSYIQVIDVPMAICGFDPKHKGKSAIKSIKTMKKLWEEKFGLAMTGVSANNPLFPFMERFRFINSGLQIFFGIKD